MRGSDVVVEICRQLRLRRASCLLGRARKTSSMLIFPRNLSMLRNGCITELRKVEAWVLHSSSSTSGAVIHSLTDAHVMYTVGDRGCANAKHCRLLARDYLTRLRAASWTIVRQPRRPLTLIFGPSFQLFTHVTVTVRHGPVIE